MLTEFDRRVAVITGAGSGFGREFARLGHQLGMRLALADVQQDALDAVADELRAAGAELIAERVDVSVGADVERLARRSREAFGQVDLLFNNAGVGHGGLIWENSVADWQWVLGVNLWGVIHGLRAFVPGMLAQRTAGHVVNTASVAGLLSPPLMGIYNVSKHAVVAASETLYQDLKSVGAAIGCSVLCPAFVPTGIHASERNRPDPGGDQTPTESQQLAQRNLERAVTAGRLGADAVAQITFDAIRAGRFYVLSHPKILGSVRLRHEDIELLRNPSDPYAYKPGVAAAPGSATDGR
ncbi:MAG: SDR family oxidoreductase [Lautropia sp.]